MSTFQDSYRQFSEAEFNSHLVKNDSVHDLITFLGVVQSMEIDILPITWEPALLLAGRGGTSEVNQSVINLQTSFAFKRLSDEQKHLPQSVIFQTLITEITVLGHSRLRQHAHVNQLQGVCWDITSDGKIWPVLVFEKTQFKDLSHFLRLTVGRNLAFEDRLKICVDVGTAVIDMDSLGKRIKSIFETKLKPSTIGIIHGDIKPANVLIFKASPDAETYSAKVIDFGYSSLYTQEDEKIFMPKSPLWHAPEHFQTKKAVKLAEARKMDLFSFGMLCLWTLFEPYLLGCQAIPPEANWAKEHMPMRDEEDFDMNILSELKRQRTLARFAEILVAYEPAISGETKANLQDFFKASLQDNVKDRAATIKQCFSSFCKLTNSPLTEDAQRPNQQFEIAPLKIPLYQSDYRVRIDIRRLLEQKSRLGQDHFTFQLAICYCIGFGGKRDVQRSQQLINRTKKLPKDLDEAVCHIHEWPIAKVIHTTYSHLSYQGYIEQEDGDSMYRQDGQLEEAEKMIRDEISALRLSSRELGTVGLLLLSSLGNMLGHQGRWKEAEELQVEVVEANKKKLGLDHPQTLTGMDNLALTYRDQGQLRKAEELQVQVMEARKTKFGAGHPQTLASMTNLASTYRMQGRWNAAKELQVQIIPINKLNRGPDHRDTLISMANLAWTYRNQTLWEKAEELEMQIVETSKTKLGIDHPDTLASMSNLGWTYRNQGRWREAEELQVHVMEMNKKKLGVDHLDTLTSMSNLAFTFWSQARWDAAEKLFLQVVENRKKKLGAGHPQTLTSIHNLASTYSNQGRWKEAEELQIQVMEMSKVKLGDDHPDTLTSMDNLALTYGNQGRWIEAEKLQVQVMETMKTKLDVDYLQMLINKGNLASTYRSQGRLLEAEELQVQNMEMSKMKLGADHPQTLASMNNLAMTWKKRDLNVKAIDLLADCIQRGQRVLGAQHPHIVSSSKVLASWEAEEASTRIIHPRDSWHSN